MPLSYEVNSSLKALAPVLDEHAEWFSLVMRRLFYPEKYAGSDVLPHPESFLAWAKEAAESDSIEKITLNRMRDIHTEMHQMASGLLKAASQGETRPVSKNFELFANLYDEFVTNLRRMERDCAQADTGFDHVTGLRNRKAMEMDLERELERRARRGRPFCLILARIDSYEPMRNELGEEGLRKVVFAASELIKKCIRSFDDAYRAGDAEFILALKHASMSGGTAGIARLRRMLEEDPILIPVKDRMRPVTMSYCSAEPVPGDNMEELVRNMRADLDRFESGGDTLLEYFEQSPLQRFLMTEKNENKA